MCTGKRQEIIESIKNMTDKEADILAVFVAGFKVGKETIEREMKDQVQCTSVEKTA